MGVELWKICGVAVLCAAVGMLLRALGGEFSTLVRVAGGVVIFAILIPSLTQTVSKITELFEVSGMERYASVMLRALGIAMLGKICTEICRDCGESGTAGGVELAGKLAILALCFPLIEEIVGYASILLAQT